jgi:hypothetical protein
MGIKDGHYDREQSNAGRRPVFASLAIERQKALRSIRDMGGGGPARASPYRSFWRGLYLDSYPGGCFFPITLEVVVASYAHF